MPMPHTDPRRPAAVETLEGRRLLTTVFLADLPPTPVDVSAGDDDFVRIVATDAAELIEFASESATPLTPVDTLNVFVDGSLRLRVAVDDALARVEVDAAGGDDTVILGRNLPVPGVVEGGTGDDLIGGSDLGDVILGGDGSDTLDGNAGGDLIDGGDGDDTLVPGRLGDTTVTFGPQDGGPARVRIVDGDGNLLFEETDLPVGIDATIDAVNRTGTARFDNASLLLADLAFGGAGDDAALGHGRVFFGGEVESLTLDGQGDQPLEDVDELRFEVSFREDDGGLLEAGALTVTAEPGEGADAEAFAGRFDDVADAVSLAGSFLGGDVDVEDESDTRKTFVFANESDDDLTAARARGEFVGGLREYVLTVADARRRFEPATYSFGNASITYDPTTDDDGLVTVEVV